MITTYIIVNLLAFVLSASSIALGIILASIGIKNAIKIYIRTSWLHAKVSIKHARSPDDAPHELAHPFSTAYLYWTGLIIPVGFTLILIGVKYLP